MGFAMQRLSVAEVACKLRHPSPLKGSPLLHVPALLPGEVGAEVQPWLGPADTAVLLWGWCFVLFWTYGGKETLNLE